MHRIEIIHDRFVWDTIWHYLQNLHDGLFNRYYYTGQKGGGGVEQQNNCLKRRNEKCV